MDSFVLLAKPIWVNLLIFVPISLFFYWRKRGLSITYRTLLLTGIFGIAFGFIESSVVIYLRASTGLLPGFEGNLVDIWRRAVEVSYNQQILATEMPISLLTIEFFREIGTGFMIIAVAILSAKKIREQVALAFWIFAFWDIFYYVWFYVLVRWPQSLTTSDLLFLIPEPWFSQVWFPILVSSLMILVTIIRRSPESKSSK
ncbi:MAG: hypothetical protein HY426_00560 [Candidatus Levybacteria bacterium]|nr:hypothetical protein [Candidatus Levybacteria bacterium]